MKRPPGAIPPLTKEGLESMIGLTVRVPYASRAYGGSWLVKLNGLVYSNEEDAIFTIVPRRYFKHRPRVALSIMRFDEEDPLVATVRRARLLAKLKL